jgi:hypothetical protein
MGSLLVLRDQGFPALHRDFEISHAALCLVEARLRAAELVLRVLEVGPEQVELGPLSLIEL